MECQEIVGVPYGMVWYGTVTAAVRMVLPTIERVHRSIDCVAYYFYNIPYPLQFHLFSSVKIQSTER